MAKLEFLITKLQHLMMSTRDDLVPEQEAREGWAGIWDILQKHDLVISSVTIVPAPRQAQLPEKANEPEMAFGKYSGKPLTWIAANDRGYFRWLATECEIRVPELKAAVLALWEKVKSSAPARQ
jgi:hypothetical protein